MARRKRLWQEVFETLEGAFEYIKRVKDINGDKVEVEMNELCGCWCVVVWWLK